MIVFIYSLIAFHKNHGRGINMIS